MQTSTNKQSQINSKHQQKFLRKDALIEVASPKMAYYNDPVKSISTLKSSNEIIMKDYYPQLKQQSEQRKRISNFESVYGEIKHSKVVSSQSMKKRQISIDANLSSHLAALSSQSSTRLPTQSKEQVPPNNMVAPVQRSSAGIIIRKNTSNIPSQIQINTKTRHRILRPLKISSINYGVSSRENAYASSSSQNLQFQQPSSDSQNQIKVEIQQDQNFNKKFNLPRIQQKKISNSIQFNVKVLRESPLKVNKDIVTKISMEQSLNQQKLLEKYYVTDQKFQQPQFQQIHSQQRHLTQDNRRQLSNDSNFRIQINKDKEILEHLDKQHQNSNLLFYDFNNFKTTDIQSCREVNDSSQQRRKMKRQLQTNNLMKSEQQQQYADANKISFRSQQHSELLNHEDLILLNSNYERQCETRRKDVGIDDGKEFKKSSKRRFQGGRKSTSINSLSYFNVQNTLEKGFRQILSEGGIEEETSSEEGGAS